MFPGKKFSEVLSANRECKITFTGEKYDIVRKIKRCLLSHLLPHPAGQRSSGLDEQVDWSRSNAKIISERRIEALILWRETEAKAAHWSFLDSNGTAETYGDNSFSDSNQQLKHKFKLLDDSRMLESFEVSTAW